MKTKFDMIGLFVEDLPRMVAFYRDVLGVEIDWNGQGPYAEFKHEGIRFSMYARTELPKLLGPAPALSGATPEFTYRLNGTFELAINVGAKENVDSRFREILAGGGREVYAPRDEPWKMRSAMLVDPEGNLIEIASDFWE
jgi:lactoylglutathione lyase